MNVKTLAKLMLPAHLLFVMTAIGIVLPDGHSLESVCRGATILLVAAGLLGMFGGLLMILQKLKFGCPYCGASSVVGPHGQRSFLLNCPNCGTVTTRMKGIWGFSYTVENESTSSNDA